MNSLKVYHFYEGAEKSKLHVGGVNTIEVHEFIHELGWYREIFVPK